MGGFSAWHWIIVAIVLLLLFGGKGKISSLMGDLAKGIKSFKSGMKDEPETPMSQPDKIPHGTDTAAASTAAASTGAKPADAARPEAKV